MTFDEKPVDVPALADYLNKSEYTIREYAKAGDIPGHKVGREWRFFLSEVRERLTSRAVETAQSPQSRGRKRVA